MEDGSQCQQRRKINGRREQEPTRRGSGLLKDKSHADVEKPRAEDEGYRAEGDRRDDEAQ
jgi:hypothetical protein